MNKVDLDSFRKIQNLFELLNLSYKYPTLDEEYDRLMSIVYQKDQAVKSSQMEKAANLRQEEIDSINRIITLLNNEKILKNNLLEVSFST